MTRLHEWSKERGVSIHQVQDAVKALRGMDSRPGVQTKLSGEELDNLEKIIEEDLVSGADESVDDDRDARIKELEARLAALESREPKSQPQQQQQQPVIDEEDLRRRIAEIHRTMQRNETHRRIGGNTVEVKKGDFIIYDTLMGDDVIIGGWVKCSEFDEPTRSRPQVAIALSPFSYDDAVGAPYHSIKFKTYKLFTKARGVVVLGTGAVSETVIT